MSQGIDQFGCIGTTIRVAKGHYVDLANFTPEMVDIDSISSALGKICRFGGHCPRFYSVAEHSLLAAGFAVEDIGRGSELSSSGVDVVRAVLYHDSAEAYIGDMVKPLKMMVPEYVEIEVAIEAAIEKALGVSFSEHKAVIKKYDRAALKCEKLAMYPEDKEEWAGFSEIETRIRKLRYLTPVDASRLFREFDGWLLNHMR